jgi:WD40 repeat protein/tetratricopeptide (TPR) repeat protein
VRTLAPPPPNPFPGLRPFRSDEHHLFFGREEQTAALLHLLRTNRFLAVVGTSGSGKSSLVRAGMIAELHGGTMTQAGSTWEVMILRPGGSPIENLARAFVDADLYEPEDPGTLPRLLATLNRSRFGLVEAMKQSEAFEPGTNLLVVVDQFEELFRFRQQGVDSEEAAAAFVNLLLTAGEQAECPIYVAITMRSDYLGDCSEIPGLAEAVNEGEYLIPRLQRDQKRDAIEKPIGVGGARIEPLLVQRLLNEVGDDPDQLPVLQHALMRMWDAWSAGSDRDRPIAFGDFEATGGLGAALSNHADEIYDSLPDDRHRSACAKLFKALTEKGDDNRGIRRPTRLAQLQAIAASDKETVTRVLDTYRGAGVTFLMPGTEVELNDRTVLDLSHESLMRGWQRLRGWVEDEAQSARIFRRLLDTARLWGDGKAGLFRDPDLQIALSWREQEVPNAEWAEQYGGHLETAIGFLQSSNAEVAAEQEAREAGRQRELEQARQLAEARRMRLEHEQRATRRLRKLIVGLAVVAAIAGLACIAALVARNDAGRLAKVAEDEADKARRNEGETASALALVESQKAKVEASLSKAEAAERSARAAEEAGRKLLYTTDMRLAPFVWGDDRTTAEQLRALLAKHIPDGKDADSRPDLRGFEWHYYQHLLERSATVFAGHGVPVIDAAFAPNGRLVTLDQNGQVRRWDLDSQDEAKASRRDLPGGPSAVVRALSPDGRLVALAEGDEVRLFDTSTGKETVRIDSANDRSRRLIFSRDGDRLVIVDDKIRWSSAASGETIASALQKFERVSSLALSADGLTLAVVGHGLLGNLFSIFRLDAAAQTVTPLAKDVGFGGTLGAAALSPDGRRIAVGAKLSGTLTIFDTTTGRTVAQHGSAHASPILAMAFSGDGAKLATGDTQGTIKIWADARTLTPKSVVLRTLKGHKGAIGTVGFSTDAKRLVSTSVDKTARVWDLANAGVAIRPLERSGSSLVSRFSPDGQLIAAAVGGGLRLWDAATGRLVQELPTCDKSRIHSVAFSPADNRLLAVGHGGLAGVSYVALWDIDSGSELARLAGATDLPGFKVTEYTGAVGTLAFSPDGKYLVAGFGSKQLFTSESSPNPLKVWEVATRRAIRRLSGHTGFCVSLDFSRDGSRMASGSRDGTAILWSTKTWGAERTLQNSDKDSEFDRSKRGMVEDVAFSPDGETLALGSYEGTVQLWDVATGRLLETLEGHSSGVSAVVFSPDGRTLASGSGDQTVRLWNVETRRELMQLDPGGIELGRVSTLAFSPDGMQLLAGGHGSTARWSAAPAVWDDADRAAGMLRRLLRSNADFPNRIRMSSENLRIHEALAKLDANDARVRAGLAATRANWHASRQAWPEAALAFEGLVAADPAKPEAWLSTPGLLRVARALLHQDRPADAARLLQGGAERRAQEGLPVIARVAGFGLKYVVEDGAVRITGSEAHSPASRAGLLPDDAIIGVNGARVTKETIRRFGRSATLADVWATGVRHQATTPWVLALHTARANATGEEANFDKMLGGPVGTKIRLMVRHPGSTNTVEVDLVKEAYRVDDATGELSFPLLVALERRLAKNPKDAGLLELRAELAGEEADFAGQLADYTAALEILAGRPDEAVSAQRRRLYRRRGDAYARARKWQEAVDDYARVITPETTDVELLANRASAHEALKNWAAAEADWSRVAAGNPQAAKRLADFARRLVAADKISLAEGPFEKARVLYERLLESAPESEPIAAELARVLLDQPPKGDASRWTVLEPTEMKSRGGATLTKREDGSILASGKNPDRDVYNAIARPGLELITAIRLEALPDPSLPENGPGRSTDGNFDLNAVRVFSGGKASALTNISASYAAEPRSIRDAISGKIDAGEGWGILPRAGEKHTLIVATLLRRGRDDDLKIDLYCSQVKRTRNNLGRFRLSVSGDPAVFDLQQKRFAAARLADPWSKLAAAYAANGRNEEALRHFATALRLAPDRAAKAGVIEEAASLKGALEELAERATGDGQAQAELARHFAVQGKGPSAKASRAKARASLEAELAREPANTVWAEELARVLQDAVAPQDSRPFRATTAEPFATGKIVDPWAELAAAYATNGERDKSLHYFSTALQRTDVYDARKAIFERAARFDEVFSALLERHPDDPQLRLALARKHAARGKQYLAEKQPAKARAEVEQSRTIFAQVLAQYPEPKWTVLTPAEMKTQTGRAMELQKDGSVLVRRGQGARSDLYSLAFLTDSKGIAGLRLEALADSRLPRGGPGTEGNFVLNELTLQVAPADSLDKARAVALRNASADFSRADWDVRAAVDGIRATGWDIPEVNKDYTAVFDVAEKVGDGRASRVTVQFYHQYFNQLGRFRLSVTSDANAVRATRIRLDLKAGELADLEVALGKVNAQEGLTEEAVASFAGALRMTTGRAGKAAIITEAASLEGVLGMLVERAAGDGPFQAELARHFARRGEASAADAARTRALTFFEGKLAKEPDNPAWPAELAWIAHLATCQIHDGVTRPATIPGAG